MFSFCVVANKWETLCWCWASTPDNLEAALRNTHRQAAQILAQQGVTGQQLDLLIVVLPDANAGVFYGKQVKLL